MPGLSSIPAGSRECGNGGGNHPRSLDSRRGVSSIEGCAMRAWLLTAFALFPAMAWADETVNVLFRDLYPYRDRVLGVHTEGWRAPSIIDAHLSAIYGDPNSHG